ncbi:hypothetical protein Rhow_004657 [Rhodococcus wratislaviensis]|uniref:Uncharacterized protein n=1 Tax=Rhodococcus wratislaviensis TaxID=44752 RepID=A0A402CBM0_RHOWR|nr:hypothetical protein Rhow_004657 [Rhodococcus wratislaviensis]
MSRTTDSSAFRLIPVGGGDSELELSSGSRVPVSTPSRMKVVRQGTGDHRHGEV